jgi:hypothetical protein
MAHYGMYVNDTSGINNIELEAQSDISYTSLGGKSQLTDFIAAHGGHYYAPLNRWILTGRALPINHLRVISPCFAQATCPGTAATHAARSPHTRARIATTTRRHNVKRARPHTRRRARRAPLSRRAHRN